MATYAYFSFSHSIDFFLGAMFLSYLTIFRRLIVDSYVLLFLFFLFVLLNFSHTRPEKGKTERNRKKYVFCCILVLSTHKRVIVLATNEGYYNQSVLGFFLFLI